MGINIIQYIPCQCHEVSLTLLTDEGWLEECLRTPEPLVADGDDLSVRKLVALLESAGACCSLHLLLEVQSNITQLLLGARRVKMIMSRVLLSLVNVRGHTLNLRLQIFNKFRTPSCKYVGP